MRIKLFIAILIAACACGSLSAAPDDIMDVAIFPVFTGEVQHDEILKNCEYMAGEAFSASARFYPIPHSRSEVYLKKSDGKDRLDLYRRAALSAGAELLCVLELSGENGMLKLSVKFEPLDDEFSSLKIEKILRARIPANIAAKGALEIARIMKGEKLKCRVTVEADGSYRINTGEWHGLTAGRYTTSAGNAEITGVERFSSEVKGITAEKGDIIEIGLYPEPGRFITRISREIDENTARFYGTDAALNKRRGNAKESIIATCVVNQGASLCFPGYGSFLSVEYMGIEKGEADMYGVSATVMFTAMHLLLPSMMNSFDINFFPWIMDSDKGKEDQRLQYFLWGSLPLTFSVSFYNQLAYQYQRKSLLPPLFEDHDTTAAVVSIFIPGGGMFYKGYRLGGWCFYLAEISAAGYAVYEWDETSGKAAAGGLILLKVLDVALAYAVTPSYSVYKNEIGSDYPDISIGLNSGSGGKGEITLSASIQF